MLARPGATDGAPSPAQRRRLGRAIDCWRSLHPDQADCQLQVAVALVPLPPSRGRVRWFLLERLC